MHGQFLQVKSGVSSSLPHHHLNRAWSVAGIFHTGEIGMPHGVWCNKPDSIQYKSFQKSCENRACTNSVYQFLVSLPTHESLGTMRLQCFFPLKFAVQYLVFHQFNCVKLCIRSIDSLTPTHQLTTLPVHCPTHPSHPTNSPPPNPSTHSLTHPQSRPSLWLPCPPQENNRRYSQEE